MDGLKAVQIFSNPLNSLARLRVRYDCNARALAVCHVSEYSRKKWIAQCAVFAYDFVTGNFAGKGESSEMSDAIGTFMPNQRIQFAVVGVRRQPLRLAGAASLAGARSSRSMKAHDPGGGPGR